MNMHHAPRAHQQLIILHCLSHAEIVCNALLFLCPFSISFLPANANAILFTTSTKCQVKYKEPVFVASQSVELYACIRAPSGSWKALSPRAHKKSTLLYYTSVTHTKNYLHIELDLSLSRAPSGGQQKSRARLNTIKVFSSSLAIKHALRKANRVQSRFSSCAPLSTIEHQINHFTVCCNWRRPDTKTNLGTVTCWAKLHLKLNYIHKKKSTLWDDFVGNCSSVV